MNRKSILIAAMIITAVTSVSKAQFIVNFDSPDIQNTQINKAITSMKSIDMNTCNIAEPLIAEPVPTFDAIPARITKITKTERGLLLNALTDSINEEATAKIQTTESIRAIVSKSEVLFAVPASKEVYDIFLQSNNPQIIDMFTASNVAARTDKNAILIGCREILKWVLIIKDGVEIGKWVKETICEPQEGSGGEGGHIPPGSETHARFNARK